MHDIKKAMIGSISHGTLKTEDLLEACMFELEWNIRRNGDYFSQPENFSERNRLNNLVGECQDAWSDDGKTLRDEELAQELLGELGDALNEFAPPYCYFGACEGDGADFGFWPCREAIDDLTSKEHADGNDYKEVNCHGNVTIYGGDGSVLLEIV